MPSPFRKLLPPHLAVPSHEPSSQPRASTDLSKGLKPRNRWSWEWCQDGEIPCPYPQLGWGEGWANDGSSIGALTASRPALITVL